MLVISYIQQCSGMAGIWIVDSIHNPMIHVVNKNKIISQVYVNIYGSSNQFETSYIKSMIQTKLQTYKFYDK